MTDEIYVIATAFPNAKVHTEKLHDDIAADVTVGPKLVGIKTDAAGNCTVSLTSAPTTPEKTALDGVVAAHQGTKTRYTFLSTSAVLPSWIGITQDAAWQEVGAVVSSPSFFHKQVNKLVGRILLESKTVGTGSQIRLVEENASDLILGTKNLGDSAGAWVTKKFWTDTNPTKGTHRYRIEARLNGATSLFVRSLTMSLLKKITQQGVAG